MDTVLLIAICYIVTVVIFLYPTKKEELPTLEYGHMMAILEKRVQEVITDKHEVYKLREIRIIHDKIFEDEIKGMVADVLTTLSPSFLKNIYYYHPREYIIQYISAQSRKFIVEYLRQNKVKTK